MDDLEEVSDYYQNRGCFNELINLMESGLGLERAHMGIFTELGVLYARYRPEKLMEHIKLFSTRLNIPKLIRACDEQQHWKELTYLYIQYDEFDNAATTIMNHSPEAWDHMQFKDVAVKVANVELYYKAVHFYLQEHPDLINDLLNVLALRVDHTRVVDIMRKVCSLLETCGFKKFYCHLLVYLIYRKLKHDPSIIHVFCIQSDLLWCTCNNIIHLTYIQAPTWTIVLAEELVCTLFLQIF